MPTYKYETKNAAGKVSSGVINAPNLAAASQQLRARGEFILALQPADGDGRGKGGFSLSFGPSAKDVQNFTSQLSVMIRAGICIRENRIFEIPNVIETSRALGMQTLDSSIKQLFVNGYISREDAIAQAAHPEKLERSLAA